MGLSDKPVWVQAIVGIILAILILWVIGIVIAIIAAVIMGVAGAEGMCSGCGSGLPYNTPCDTECNRQDLVNRAMTYGCPRPSGPEDASNPQWINFLKCCASGKDCSSK